MKLGFKSYEINKIFKNYLIKRTQNDFIKIMNIATKT